MGESKFASTAATGAGDVEAAEAVPTTVEEVEISR
jgi:hypothetical protein